MPRLSPILSSSGIAAIAVCCVGMGLPAIAAPPANRIMTAPAPVSAEGLFSVHASAKGSLTAGTAVSAQVLPSHLDLRPPSGSEFGETINGSGVAANRFALAREQREERETGGNALGSDAAQVHPMGLAQGMAERFHREGLPVARLWENHSALVSLGLNQKGKPGIWLVQKTH